jgi:hypothetical protein
MKIAEILNLDVLLTKSKHKHGYFDMSVLRTRYIHVKIGPKYSIFVYIYSN